jgi:indole-3-glycerol phosphate synthase
MLDAILDNKRRELPDLRRKRLPAAPALRPVRLRRGPGEAVRLITEIKRRSPSAGVLSSVLGVAERARAYEEAGASMISVLCDAKYFGGSYEDMALARAATSVPLLCKEFVLEESQLDAARAYGADAVLLIARCLSPERLQALTAGARERGLEVLLEVYLPEEVPIALGCGAELVGVNARDLNTLRMDAPRAERILAELPERVVRVHLSGIQNESQVATLAGAAVDAALIGECLMRLDDPRPLLKRLVAAGKPA